MTQHSRRFRFRFAAVAAVVAALFGALFLRLMALQIREGQGYSETSESKVTKELTLTGGRGSIVDRNGVVLAYDRDSHNVAFYRDPSKNAPEELAAYSASLAEVCRIVEENGGRMVGSSYFVRQLDGSVAFDFGTEDADAAASREALFRSNFYLGEKLTAQECYDKLILRYGLSEYDADGQLKLLGLWQQLQMNAYLSKPVPVAYDVDLTIVSIVEARSIELPGVSIAESTARVYPFGSLAAHVLGYCGRMTDAATIQAYAEKGYSADALIGVAGIEYTMEEQLSANVSYRQGKSIVERNANGAVTRELSTVAPTDGDTVVLTLDVGYQQVLEAALQDNIDIVHATQQEVFGAYTDEQKAVYQTVLQARGTEALNMAQSGAAVVLNVNTGEVLAIASNPAYELNQFVGGISEKAYRALLEDKRAPLFNRAVSSKSTPGSIFKMLTALAGLSENAITVSERIDDLGYFNKYVTSATEKGPSCWVRPNFSRHSHQTVADAVKNSCNYYFFVTADRLGIRKLKLYADAVGLTSKTGIELASEATSIVGNQELLYDIAVDPFEQPLAKTRAVAYALRDLISGVGAELDIVYDEDRVGRTVKGLMDLAVTADTEEQPDAIRQVLMSELSLSVSDISSRYLVNQISASLQEIRWTGTETIMTGIGQSVTELTPVAVARYVAAVANGGTVYEVRLVDKVLSASGGLVTDKESVVFQDLRQLNPEIPEYLSAIRMGMHGVISSEDGGTAAKYFIDYPYTDLIGAKTGTAQVNTIEIEDNAWFVAFAPYEDPEICVVVFIPNGYSGGLASLTAKDVFTYFFESQSAAGSDEAAAPGELLS